MLWLDAENVDGQFQQFHRKGAVISQWNDLSGNGNHVSESTGVGQPSSLHQVEGQSCF